MHFAPSCFNLWELLANQEQCGVLEFHPCICVCSALWSFSSEAECLRLVITAITSREKCNKTRRSSQTCGSRRKTREARRLLQRERRHDEVRVARAA